MKKWHELGREALFFIYSALPSCAEVHAGKPLPVRQRQVNRTASVDTPAFLVKTIKKTTVKKDQEA